MLSTKELIPIVLVHALITISGFTHAASPNQKIETTEIDSFCLRGQEFGRQHEKKIRHFAEVTKGVLSAQPQQSWREFSNVAALKKAIRASDTGIFSQMRYWTLPDGITYVEAFFTSDSGDWSNLVEYCYRSDGTLAREDVTYNNITMVIQSWQVRYFDNSGQALKMQREVFNLETKKPLPIENFQKPGNPLYTRVKSLPFFNFIQK